MCTCPFTKFGSSITRPRNGIVVVMPSHDERVERQAHLGDGLGAVAALADDLRDHRVVERRHRVARVHVRVHAHAVAARRMEHVDPARATAGSSARDPRRSRGTRSRGRGAAASSVTLIFSPAAMRICSFTRSTPVTISVTGMLDLDARVHLHEVERAVLVEQELHRAGADVADGLRAERRRRRPSSCAAPASSAGLGASSMSFWWRRCTEQSRSPRWMHVAVRVAEDLELDVARPLEVLLDVDRAVAERRERLGARHLEAARELVGVARDAHPLAAAARGGLDDDREADLARRRRARPRRRPPGPGVPGTTGTPFAIIVARAAALSPIVRICSAWAR